MVHEFLLLILFEFKPILFCNRYIIRYLNNKSHVPKQIKNHNHHESDHESVNVNI